MSRAKYFGILLLTVCFTVVASGEGLRDAGPFYAEFELTLAPGRRKEALGPLFYSELKESQRTWAFPLLTLSHTEDPDTDSEEYDFAYPLFTLDRYGAEYRFQIFQLINFGGGQDQQGIHDRRFSLFPVYFQQRSADPSRNYTALFPLYGHLDHRFFRDEIDFALFPLYSKTRRKDVVTRNMPYPFFHLRHGDGLEGWQLWPLVGHEHKVLTTSTNGFGDVAVVGGHDHRFVLWPFFTQSDAELGTDKASHQQTLMPFYSLFRSKLRDSTSYGWPLGVTHTVDREKKYVEWDAPWPLVEFAHGEGKTTRRVWPFFSEARTQYLEDDWYAWPIYKYNRFTAAPLDRTRTRLLFFLYSDLREKDTDTGKLMRRVDFWPLFTHRHDRNGDERLQVLSILEPIFPANKSLARDFSQLYALWRDERNPRTGAASQSLLWNLYRRDTTPDSRKCSLLFGLFQYQSTAEGRRWRVCYVPVARAKPTLQPSKPR